MTEWYEFFGFKLNPYERKPNPMSVPYELIAWNRDDLRDKWQLDRFLEDILAGKSRALRIFGPTNSGKTWLLRYIDKCLVEKTVILYAAFTRVEPTFPIFFRIFVEDFEQRFLEKFLKAVNEKVGLPLEKWEEYVGDPDLGRALYHIAHKDEHYLTSRRWFRGEKLSFSLLSPVGIISPLTDYGRMKVLRTIISKIVDLFPYCVFMVDEIGLVTPSVGRTLGGALKELMDTFYEKFGLVCSYTATISDALVLERGYDEHFYRRFDYEVELSAIPRDFAPKFLRLHHRLYRKEGARVDDELLPFTKEAIEKLYDLIRPDFYYPGYLLKACGNLVKEAYDSKPRVKVIDADFVEKTAERLPREMLRKTT